MKNAFSSWINSGGYYYMVSKKIIDKNDSHFAEDDKGNKTFNIDNFWKDPEATAKTGGFMKKLFSKDFYNESATATVFAKYAEIKDK